MKELIDLLDPSTYIGTDAYLAWWQVAFATMFMGVYARLWASVCLFYAFWYGVYKQRFAVGLLFFLATMLFAYGGSVAWLLGWVSAQ